MLRYTPVTQVNKKWQLLRLVKSLFMEGEELWAPNALSISDLKTG